MKNNLYFDADFNFLLLECEESNYNGIYLYIPTSDAINQRLEISVAGGAATVISLPSSTDVRFELSQEYWADDNETTITAKNNAGLNSTIAIVFPKATTESIAVNYINDDTFEVAQQQEEATSGEVPGSGGTSYGNAVDFVETIRNIGFRLLDEPINATIYYDEATEEVKIKWQDPPDITTNEPCPATWAGTVVVRKEGGAPLHKWDGEIIEDTTTRNEYETTPLVDSGIVPGKQYYYGIFPYDTKGDYRFTKVLALARSENTYIGDLRAYQNTTRGQSTWTPTITFDAQTQVNRITFAGALYTWEKLQYHLEDLIVGNSYKISFSFRSVNTTTIAPDRSYGERVLATSVSTDYATEVKKGILGFATLTNLSASEDFVEYEFTFTAANNNFIVFDFSAVTDLVTFIQEFKDISIEQVAEN